MLNKTIIQGRMTKDPELRHTQSGTAVSSFTLAVERDFKNQDGKKEADFINCVSWKGTAEFISRYFAKGRMAVVEGHLQSRRYQDKEGNQKTAIEVVAENVYFGDSKKDGNTPSMNADRNQDLPQNGDWDDNGEDLPF